MGLLDYFYILLAVIVIVACLAGIVYFIRQWYRDAHGLDDEDAYEPPPIEINERKRW